MTSEGGSSCFGTYRKCKCGAFPLSCQQRREPLEIDVPAADDNPHALSLELGFQLARRRKPEAAGGFRYDLHSRGKEAHALNQLSVGRGEDVVDIALDDRERVGA